MNIFEYQAKKLLKANGVSIPAGDVAMTAQEAEEISEKMSTDRWVVKAQIRSGGRGDGSFSNDKSLSGVQFAEDSAAVRNLADKMLNNTLHTSQTGRQGVKVKSVYVEELVEFDKQLSLSLVVDTRVNTIVLLISKIAGSNIESVAVENPDLVFNVPVDVDDGIDKQLLAQAFSNLDLDSSHYASLESLITILINLFIDKDASLVEINPLVIKGDQLIVLDAKVSFDNNALYRHDDIQALGQGHSFERSEDSLMASRDGFNYTELDGDIGILAVGAGLSLATIDAVKHWSGEPANFLDLPPDSRVTRVRSALELLLSKPNIKSILINVFGGGIMRCDAIVDAMLLVNKEKPLNNMPLTVRLTGMNSNIAVRRLKDVMPDIKVFDDLSSAAKSAVELANSEPRTGINPSQVGFWEMVKSKFIKH